MARRATRAFAGTKLNSNPRRATPHPPSPGRQLARWAKAVPGSWASSRPMRHIPNARRLRAHDPQRRARGGRWREAGADRHPSPSLPDTAYGYVHIGKGSRGAVPVKRFHEKPDPARARRFYERGEYVWNAGMVIARPERILSETHEHAPEVWKGLGPYSTSSPQASGFPRRTLTRALSPRRAHLLRLPRARAQSSVVRRTRAVSLGPISGSSDALERASPLGWTATRCKGEAPVALDSTGNIVWNFDRQSRSFCSIRRRSCDRRHTRRAADLP